MEVLTRLREHGTLAHNPSEVTESSRGLILPPYNRPFTVVSRMSRPNYQGPIADVFYVREAITEDPLVLKPSKIGPFRYMNEDLERMHEYLAKKGYEFSPIISASGLESKESTDMVGYRRPGAIGNVVVAIDGEGRITPNKMQRLLRGDSLTAKILLKSHARGISPPAYHMSTEHLYTTDEVVKMLKDSRFDVELLSGVSKLILEDATRYLPSTKELGQYLVLWGWS